MLTHFEGGDVQALVGSYSPDGRWIVFRLEDHGSYGLYKMHPDGSHMKAILPLSSFKPRVIAWGPKLSEENDDEDTVEVNEPSAGTPSVPVAEQGSPKMGNWIPSLDSLDGDRIRFSSKSSCALYGMPCSPNGGYPRCCGTLECVFSGGSTRVGYACK